MSETASTISLTPANNAPKVVQSASTTPSKTVLQGKTILMRNSKSIKKRHGKMAKRRIQDLLKKPQIRRIAHRAGATRFGSDCYPVVRGGIRQILHQGLYKGAVMTDYAKRQRIRTKAMRYGLAHCGKSFLGLTDQ